MVAYALGCGNALKVRRWSSDVSDFKAASRLRHHVMEMLRADSGLYGDYAAVELILGELLGNVARHTPGAIVVNLEIREGRAYLTVSDEGSGIGDVSRLLPADALSESGRGMFLIASLARGLDVTGSRSGTTVRVELPLDTSDLSATG
jgi:anti-sigma regulatory factor (Ser/Thr protein kinase)